MHFYISKYLPLQQRKKWVDLEMEKYVKSPILLQNFIHGVLFQVLTFLNNSVVSDNISGSSVAEWLWLNSERTVIKQGACQRLLTLHCSYSTMCQMH